MDASALAWVPKLLPQVPADTAARFQATKMLAQNLSKYTALGKSPVDRATFALFGALAPSHDISGSIVGKILARLIPRIWLRPTPLSGLQLLIKPTDWSQTVVFDEVFIERNYDLEELDLIPDLILDCGAHIGLFSLMASALFPAARIIAFEPNPKNAAQVRHQIARNSLSVELIQAAVSTEVSERYFWESNTHNGHLLRTEEEGDVPSIGFRVKTIDLPAMLRELNPRTLLIKIDIEGEEETLFPVLIPCLPRECTLYFETHSGDRGWDDASHLLTTAGFQVEQTNRRDRYADGIAIRHA